MSLQTQSGKLVKLTLSTHETSPNNNDYSNEEMKQVIEKNISLGRFTNAWQLCLGKFLVQGTTVWKSWLFFVIQILCEINFGESRSSETAVLAILGALYFANLIDFSLQKVQKFIKSQNSEPPNVLKRQILHF